MCKMTQKTSVALHICEFYSIVTVCDRILTSTLSMAFVLTQSPSYTFTSTLSEFELFAAHLTDQTAQNMKTQHYYL